MRSPARRRFEPGTSSASSVGRPRSSGRCHYAIVVRDLTGQQLVNTRVPWGTPLPKGADPDADKEVIETRLPFVQDLFTGATANRPVLSVRVPVLADESVTHVLSVAFEPAHIAGIIGEQNLPTAWTATVLDRNSRVIARSQRHAQYLGIEPAEGFGAAEARENRAWRGISLEGEPVLGAFAQSKLSGWRAFVGVPERVVQAPLWRSLWLIAALAAVLLAISFLLAFWFGRRIARPIQRRAKPARSGGDSRCTPSRAASGSPTSSRPRWRRRTRSLPPARRPCGQARAGSARRPRTPPSASSRSIATAASCA